MITLSVNGLNFPVKRYRLANWMNKHDSIVCCIQEVHFIGKDAHRQRYTQANDEK
jgi:exonuclease III